jgi:SAM-dependent methyltransferase
MLRAMERRTYYDHEPVYRKRRDRGFTGWNPPDCTDAFRALDDFLVSEWCPPVGRALDLGCGGGEACVKLAALGWQVVGLDFSPTAVSLARQNAERAGVAPDLLVADAVRRLPTPPGAFDLVLDNHVLHCLVEKGDRRSFLANARGAFCESGVLFSANMSAEGHLDFARHDIDPVTRIDRHRTRQWATERELLDELRAAGLAVGHMRYYRDEDEHGMGDELVVYARAD